MRPGRSLTRRHYYFEPQRRQRKRLTKVAMGLAKQSPTVFSFLAVQHALRMPGRTNQRDRNRA